MTERIIACDMKLDEWTVGEADAYRKAVGVNAEYAYGALMEALRTTRDEARDTFGDVVDAEDWTPPDDWLPMAMLNVPPLYLAGFAYVAALRDEPGLDFADFVKLVRVGELTHVFYAELTGAADPLVNRAQRRARAKSRPSKPASPSASSTAGRSGKSAP